MRGLIERFRGRRPAPPRRLPVGTVTFVLTDIEGSTRLWETQAPAMERVIVRHTRHITEAVERRGGTVIRERGEGDSTFSVFTSAPAAIAAAVDFQRAFVQEPWPPGIDLRVRVGVHTGDTTLVEDEYSAPAINRCARIREVASGGQVLVSEQTANLATQDLGADTTLRDLGPHRLRDLSRPMRIYQALHSELPEDFPALRSLEGGRHNLPVQLTSFIGRDREVSEVRKLLATSRMVNLTGPGGIGKTRIAQQVAGDLIETYPDGVWFVDLSPLSDADRIPEAASRALSLREEPGRPVLDTVLDHLRGARALLILDNCEHVLDGATSFANTVLRGCVEVGIVATAREALRVPGATTWKVPSMAVPGPQDRTPTESLQTYEGIRLFCERAGLVRPDFALTHDTGPIVANICRRLDGVPLAIELAAAAVRSMTPGEIDTKLDDRFRVLTGGGPDTPRHETLLATVDWSHDLLAPVERVLFRRLAVFAGGFTLEGAEEVCSGEGVEKADVIKILAALVDKSLVAADVLSDQTRYALLETMREYAAGKLAEAGETGDLADRHLDYFATYAERTTDELEGPNEAHVLSLLEAEHDNFRAALTHAFENARERAVAFAAVLARFWLVRGYWTEGRDWLARALAVEAEPRDRARALAADGALAASRGELVEARSKLEEAVATARTLADGRTLCRTLPILAEVLQMVGARDLAHQLFSECLQIALERADGIAELAALSGLGVLRLTAGDFRESIELFERGVHVAHRIAAPNLLLSPLMLLGHTLISLGKLEEASQRLEEALHIARDVQDRSSSANCLISLGDIAQSSGDNETARHRYEDALAIRQQLGDKVGVADSLYRIGDLARLMQNMVEAKHLLRESLDLAAEVGNRLGVAAALHSEALICRSEGKTDEALSLLSQSLPIALELDYLPGVIQCIEAFGGVAIDRSRPDDAVRLFGVSDSLRDKSGITRSETSAKEVQRDLFAAKTALGTQAFDNARDAGLELTLDDGVRIAGQLT